MGKEFSFFQLIKSDYIASLSVLFPLVFWGILLFQYITKKELSTPFFAVCVLISGIAFFVLLWRYRMFLRLFEEGVEIVGTINDVTFSRDRGYISYVYTYEGQKYLSKNYISKTNRARLFRPGEQVILVIDRNNPKKAFIRELYE
jgi:hypothetical protein